MNGDGAGNSVTLWNVWPNFASKSTIIRVTDRDEFDVFDVTIVCCCCTTAVPAPGFRIDEWRCGTGGALLLLFTGV